MSANGAATFSRETFVAANHPCLPGHFPGDPLVPGVLILDIVSDLLHQWLPGSRIIGIAQAKFYRMLRPEQRISVTLSAAKPNSIKFECLRGPDKIASGIINIETPS